MKFSRKIRLGNWGLMFKLIIAHMAVRTSGISSRIPSTGYHILMMDYDSIDLRRLNEELTWLQAKFKLGSFIVFETNEYGRHVWCLDVLTLRQVLQVLRYSNCDEVFQIAPKINPKRSWVLRFDKKGNRKSPKYLYTLPSPHEGYRRQSRGHAKFLLKYGLKVELEKPYGPEEVEIQTYYTTKKNV